MKWITKNKKWQNKPQNPDHDRIMEFIRQIEAEQEKAIDHQAEALDAIRQLRTVIAAIRKGEIE